MAQKVVCLLGPVKSGKSHTLLSVAAAVSHKHEVLVVSFDQKIDVIEHMLQEAGAKRGNVRVRTFDPDSDTGNTLARLNDLLDAHRCAAVDLEAICIDHPYPPIDYPMYQAIAEANGVDVYYTSQMHKKMAKRQRRPKK